MTSASEPARPTDATAPLFACALRSLLDGASAVSVSPFEEAAPSMRASLVMFASVIAMAAPIAADPPVALPSAVDDASAASLECRLSAPPAFTNERLTVALALAFVTVTATAAATLIGPTLVDADGV